MKFNPSIFREYDIRGIVDQELTDAVAETLGKAYASFIRNRTPTAGRSRLTVSVGRDCRFSGEHYAEALTRGLLSYGINVVSLGVCPTPLTYFSIFNQDLDGGIMITGSHNPSNYNGFKICVGKDTLHGHQIQEMHSIMETLPPYSGEHGTASSFDIIPAYLDYLLEHMPKLSKKKVVLDAGNGVAGNVAPPLFEKLGAEVIPLFCELDGNFPNHHPDPTVHSNLKDLVATVIKEKADFGIAFDGDGDRIGVVDNSGKILFGDELMVIFSRDVLKSSPGATIISEVKSSHRLYQDIAAKGGKPIMWKTGHSLIKSKMKESKAALAGEMSGHVFFADRYYGYDDAIYAAARFYEIATKAGGPTSTLLLDLPKMVATPEIRVDCEELKKFDLVRQTKVQLAKNHKINDIDGVRVEFGDSWGLVRASNTQPVLVLRFEAPTEARLKEIRDIIETELKTAAEAIHHAPIVIGRSDHP